MTELNLRLLGECRLLRGVDTVIAVPGRKTLALLAYLALNPDQPHGRDKLAALLWGDRPDEQARHSLRQTIFDLRKALGDQADLILESDTRSLELDMRAVDVDVHRFERLAGEDAPQALADAARLYTGELLDGTHVRAEEFEQWLRGERTRLRELATNVQRRLAVHYDRSGEVERAMEAACSLVRLDPLCEAGHRILMRLHAGSGSRSNALRQYQICADALRQEMDVEPETETTELFDRIRQQQPEDRRGQNRDAQAPRVYADPGEPLAPPDRPSIAVLPFENLSSDPEQEYFADGVAGDIIAALARFRWLFVIARNSSFTYKGRTPDVKDVSLELGVRYVLEGSVRRSGRQVRLTAELIDAPQGRHIWAGCYDRELGDIFAVQDEITQSVIAAVSPELLSAEAVRARKKDPRNLDGWDYVIRAQWHIWRFNMKDCAEAKRLLRKAIELDQENVRAFTGLAEALVVESLFGWGEEPSPLSLLEAHNAAQKAIAIDAHDASPHIILGVIDAFSGRAEDGIRKLRKAIEINPNIAMAYGFLGWAYAFTGQSDPAIELFEKAVRLSPRDPMMVLWDAGMSAAAFVAGRYEEAVKWARKSIEARSDWPSGYRLLAASCGQLGWQEEARAAISEVLRVIPNQTAENLRVQIPYVDPGVVDCFLEGMRKAGLPEK